MSDKMQRKMSVEKQTKLQGLCKPAQLRRLRMQRSILCWIFVLIVDTLYLPAAPISFTVDARANIFGAGHSSPPAPVDGSGGLLPFESVITSAPGLWLQFMNVTGSTNCVAGTPFNGPDGGFCIGGPGTNVFSTGGISGIVDFGKQMFLTGVFTNGIEPADPAPPRLNLTGAESFTDLFPLLNQTFYIGDGLTGTGSGAVQKFHVPLGANHLYLGFVDSIGFGLGGGLPPGAYGDNAGSLSGQFEIVGPTEGVPEPSAVSLVSMALAIAAVGSYRFRRV